MGSKGKQSFGEAGQLSPDGSILYSYSTYKGGVNAWNATTGKHLFELQDSSIVGSSPDCSFGGALAVSPDGGKLWGSGRDRGVGEWCAMPTSKQGSSSATASCRPGEFLEMDKIRNEDTGDVLVSPDGKVLYSYRDDEEGGGSIWLTDTKSRKTLDILDAGIAAEPCLALSLDGSVLYAKDGDKTIIAFDTKTREKIFELSSSNFVGMLSLTLSPDGGTLYVACRDGRVRAWDTEKHTQLYAFFAGQAHTCTSENEDPYATSVKIPCCPGLEMELKNWNGDGRWFYKCNTNTLMLV